MKKFLGLVLAVLLAAPALAAPPAHINSEGLKTNPTGGTVLADTGPVDANCYSIRIQMMSNVLSTMNVEQRNSTNAATIGPAVTQAAAGVTIYYGLLASTNYDFETGIVFLCFNQDERLRVVNTNNITGSTQATIYIQ